MQRLQPRLERVALAAALGLLSSACLSDRDTCEHYAQKSFNPMPEKAWKACRNLCEGEEGEIKELACSALERWEYARAETEREEAERAQQRAFIDDVRDARQPTASCGADPAPCERACERGDVMHCAWLGDHLLDPANAAGDEARGLAALERACALHDDARACPDRDCSGDLDPTSCAVLRRDDCDEGEGVKSCVDRYEGQRACDRLLARDCLLDVDGCRAACERDQAPYCRQLALMYKTGDGVPRNSELRARHAARACALGDTWSCPPGPKRQHVQKLKSQRLPAASETPAAAAPSPAPGPARDGL